MRLIDYLYNISANTTLKILKQFMDKEWLLLHDIRYAGHRYTKTKLLLKKWTSIGILISKEHIWETGRGRIKMKTKKYKINNKSGIVKMLKKEIKNEN